MLPGITPPLNGPKMADWNTTLLLHNDGANGSTVIVDASPYKNPNATVAGGCKQAVAQKKFGNASMALVQASSGCTFPNSPGFEFAGGNFTVDWWEYRTAAPANSAVVARDNVNKSPAASFTFGQTDGTNTFVYCSSNGSAWDIANGQLLGSVDLNVWNHMAVVRRGNTFFAFKNGVQQSTWTSALAILANTNPIAIGMWNASAYFYTGYLDEIRVSKGIARWVANFAPPTVPYS